MNEIHSWYQFRVEHIDGVIIEQLINFFQNKTLKKHFTQLQINSTEALI